MNTRFHLDASGTRNVWTALTTLGLPFSELTAECSRDFVPLRKVLRTNVALSPSLKLHPYVGTNGQALTLDLPWDYVNADVCGFLFDVARQLDTSIDWQPDPSASAWLISFKPPWQANVQIHIRFGDVRPVASVDDMFDHLLAYVARDWPQP